MSHNDSSPDNTRTTFDETKSGTDFTNHHQQQHEAASPNSVLIPNSNDNENNNNQKIVPKLAVIPSLHEAEEMFLAALGGRNEIAAENANNNNNNENDSFTVTPRRIRHSINMSNLNNNNNNNNDDTRSQFTTRSTRSMGGMSSQRGDFVNAPQNFDYATLSSIMAQGNDTQLASTAGMSQSRSVLSRAREGTLSVERVGGNYGCELVIVKARKGGQAGGDGSEIGFGDDEDDIDVDDDFSDTTSRIGGGTDSVFGEYSPNIRRSVGGRSGNEGETAETPRRQQQQNNINTMNDAEAEAKFRAQQELFKQQSRRYSDAPQGLIEVANDFSMVRKKGSQQQQQQQDQAGNHSGATSNNNQIEQIMLAKRLGQQQNLNSSNQQIQTPRQRRKAGSSVASFGNPEGHQEVVLASPAPPPSAVMLEAMKFVEETKKKAAEKRAKELQLQQQEDELQQERNRNFVENQKQLSNVVDEGVNNDNDGETAVKLSLDKLKAHNERQLSSVGNNNNNNNNNNNDIQKSDNNNNYDENAQVPLSALAKPKQQLDAKSAVSRKSVKIIVKRVPKKSKEGIAAAATKNEDGEIQDQEEEVGVIEASPENNNMNNEESSPAARNPTATDASISQQQQSQQNEESSTKKQEKSQKSKQTDDYDVQSIISRATAKGAKIIVVKKVSKHKSIAGSHAVKSEADNLNNNSDNQPIEENINNHNKVDENSEQQLQQPAITVSTNAIESEIHENEANTKNVDHEHEQEIEVAASPEAKNPESNHESEDKNKIQEQQKNTENQISPRITDGISGTVVDTTSNNNNNNNNNLNNNNNINDTPRFSTGSVLHNKSRHSMGKSKPPAIEPTGDSAHVSISICEGSLHPEHKNYRNAEDFEQDNLLRTQDLDDERERIDREDIANHFAKAVVRNGEGNSRHESMKFMSSNSNNNIAEDNNNYNCSGKSTPETTTDEAKPASTPAILNSSSNNNNNNNITSASSSSNLDNAGSKKEIEQSNDGEDNKSNKNCKIEENHHQQQQDEALSPLITEFLHLKKPKNAKNRAKVLTSDHPSSKFLVNPSKSKSLAPLGIYEPNCSKCHTKSYPPPPHWKCTKTEGGKNCGGMTWQPDQNFCTFCNVEFTFFTRHHHCYLCGKSACDECTAQKECLPIEAWNNNENKKTNVWNLSDPSAKFRCCKLCFKRKSFDFLPSDVQKKKQQQVEVVIPSSSSSLPTTTNVNSNNNNQKILRQREQISPTLIASQSSFKLIPVSEFGEEHENHSENQQVAKSTKNDDDQVVRSRIKFVLDETALPSAIRKKREDEEKEKEKLSQETDRLYLNDRDEATVRVFFSEVDETLSFSEIRNFDDLFQLEMEHRRLIKDIRKREVVAVNNCYLHHGVVNGLFRGLMERFVQIEEKVRQQDEKQSQQKNEKKNTSDGNNNNNNGEKKKNVPVPGCTIGNFPIMEATKDILSFTGSPKFAVDEVSIFGDDFEAIFSCRTSMLTRHEEELQNANKELKMNANRLKKMEGCCAF